LRTTPIHANCFQFYCDAKGIELRSRDALRAAESERYVSKSHYHGSNLARMTGVELRVAIRQMPKSLISDFVVMAITEDVRVEVAS